MASHVSLPSLRRTTGAAALLLVLSPLLLALALAVRLSLGSPVLFVQLAPAEQLGSVFRRSAL